MTITKTAADALLESQSRKKEELDANIRGALTTLREDSTIKPNQANLAKLAGCHTVTLREREWPFKELRELKSKAAGKAKLEKMDKEALAKNNRLSITKLNNNLADEVLLWFDKAMEYKRLCDSVERERNKYRESSELNARKAAEYKSSLKTAKQYMRNIHGVDLDGIINP